MFGHECSRSSTRVIAMALGVLALAGCNRGDDTRPLVVDSAGGSVAERDPNTTATTVFALLTDANVFAVLDTSYSMIIAVDSIGQSNARDERVRQFAQHAMSQNALAQSGIRTTADRLNIAPALPNQYVIRDRLEDVEKLSGEHGADFERDYLDRVVDSRRDMVDDIDDALAGKGIQQNAVREFLRELRSNLDADRRQAEALRAAASRK